jgi:hypothetical protein
MNATVTRTGPHALSIRLAGRVGNPLIRGAGIIAAIDWDLILTLDSSGPTTHWTLTGTDDGFPSWELYINGKPIYVRDAPPPYTDADLRKLLPGLGDLQINILGILQ